MYNNTDFMTFFLPDCRIGFVSRAFIGPIIYLFTNHPTVRMVATIPYIAIFDFLYAVLLDVLQEPPFALKLSVYG